MNTVQYRKNLKQGGPMFSLLVLGGGMLMLNTLETIAITVTVTAGVVTEKILNE